MIGINNIFKKVLNGYFLNFEESRELFNLIINKEIDPISISSILSILSFRGESFDEIFGAINVLKEKAKKIHLDGDLIDTCGTGGDNKGSFNISTATAILASACGLSVAKHGNRSITSKSGSSDVLTALGINIQNDNKIQKGYFKNNNICFLFAPFYHSSLKNVMDIRQKLPFKTIFNLLGPLLNPAKLKYQLLGVGEKKNLKTHSNCLSKMDLKSAWVVNSENGFDELTTTSPNFVYKIKDNKISKLYKIFPEEAGLNISNDSEIKGGTPDENAYIMKRLFEGETGAIRDNVLFNTSACLVISGKVKNLKEGVFYASKQIDNLNAKSKLDQLIKSSE
ncbi:anthranilate phosphoribosyltransferase [Rickettsiales bacterium]|nr:anthranilate phosphoribosyltransferase [Rickettsiales bacterium]